MTTLGFETYTFANGRLDVVSCATWPTPPLR
jgi:hypothetical protein